MAKKNKTPKPVRNTNQLRVLEQLPAIQFNEWRESSPCVMVTMLCAGAGEATKKDMSHTQAPPARGVSITEGNLHGARGQGIQERGPNDEN